MSVVPSAVDPSTDPGRGRRLGLDVGLARVGVAASDPDGLLATPVETIYRVGARGTALDEPAAEDVEVVVDILDEYEAVELVVGLPRTMRGEAKESVAMATVFARAVTKQRPLVPVRWVDERLTTAVASRGLRASGRSSRDQKSIIDQAAAVAILQTWLDRRRAVLGGAPHS